MYIHTYTPKKSNKYTHVYRPTEISIPHSLVPISSQMQTHMSIQCAHTHDFQCITLWIYTQPLPLPKLLTAGGAHWRWMRECLSTNFLVSLGLWLHPKKKTNCFFIIHYLELLTLFQLFLNRPVFQWSSIPCRTCYSVKSVGQGLAAQALLKLGTNPNFATYFAQISKCLWVLVLISVKGG